MTKTPYAIIEQHVTEGECWREVGYGLANAEAKCRRLADRCTDLGVDSYRVERRGRVYYRVELIWETDTTHRTEILRIGKKIREAEGGGEYAR